MATAQAASTFFTPCPAWIWGIVNITVFFAKVAALLFFFIWVRWTLPRFRYDQLMKLGWLYIFEIALVNIFLTAGILAFTQITAMAYVVPRPNLTWKEKIYLPSIVAGLAITFKHLKRMLTGKTKVVMQYPEEKWDAHDARALSRRADAGDGRARPRALRGLPALRVHLPAARDHDQAGGNSRARSSSPRSRSGRRNSTST